MIQAANWSKDGVKINNRKYRQLTENGVCYLAIDQVQPEDAGTFSCQVVTDDGLMECSALLEVKGRLFYYIGNSSICRYSKLGLTSRVGNLRNWTLP